MIVLAPWLKKLTQLRSLNLSRNLLKIVALSPSLGQLIQLQYLNINYNEITTEGIIALKPSIQKLFLLRELYIIDNLFDTNDLKELGLIINQLPSLVHLGIDYDSLSISENFFLFRCILAHPNSRKILKNANINENDPQIKLYKTWLQQTK